MLLWLFKSLADNIMRLTQIENYDSGPRLEDYKCAEITFLEISILSIIDSKLILDEKKISKIRRGINE